MPLPKNFFTSTTAMQNRGNANWRLIDRDNDNGRFSNYDPDWKPTKYEFWSTGKTEEQLIGELRAF